MPMIEGINGAALINALRQGREDRYVKDQRELEAAQQRAAQQRQAQVDSARARATGVGLPQQGGVMGNAQPTMGAPMGGELPALGAPQQGGVAAMAQPAAMGRPQADPSAMTEWLVLDPEGAGKYMAGLKNMNEGQVKQQQARNDMMGGAARYLSRIPPAQRPAALQRLMPQMMGAGWTEQELAGVELSDEALMGYQAVAIDFDKVIDNDLAERKFMAGDNIAMQPGGGVANVRPTFGTTGQFTGNVAETVIAPNMGDQPVGAPVGEPTHDGPAPPPAAVEHLRKNPGLKAQFDAKYGQGAADRALGGASGNVGGGFSGFKRAIIAQESGGRYGVTNTEGSGAMGVGQIMPETGAALAKREGLPWRPDLMRGNSAEARAYQDRLTDAALKEAWEYGGGDPGKAAKYYFAGPNRKGWGPKTKVYGESVVRRMRAR